jgi:Zn finger protein HypA/HybF involved in hydrogenase expression
MHKEYKSNILTNLMHEQAFAKAILKDLELIRDKSKEISQVVIELGELVGIEEDHLLEGLNSQSTTSFKIISKKSLIKCPCGYEGPAKVVERLHDLVIWKCPWCDDPIETMQIIQGDKINIQKIIYK